MFANIIGNNSTELDDATICAAVMAAIEAYRDDEHQQYIITGVKFKDKVSSPWRLIGLYEQVSRFE